jgi:hypothetical protein
LLRKFTESEARLLDKIPSFQISDVTTQYITGRHRYRAASFRNILK